VGLSSLFLNKFLASFAGGTDWEIFAKQRRKIRKKHPGFQQKIPFIFHKIRAALLTQKPAESIIIG